MLKPQSDNLAHEAYQQAMSTNGTRKIHLYFENLVKDEKFRDRVAEIRGFEDSAPRPFALAGNPELRKHYDEMIDSLCMDYRLPKDPWALVIDNIVQTDNWEFNYEGFGFDICKIEVDTNDKIYPIKIGISPYASREDMIDFIKTNFREFLLPLQKEFQIKGINVNKFKARRKEELYEFIFNNQNMPPKEIMSIVADKFGEVYGYDQIRKILERERRRRNIK
jgi:hypothetical protein